MAQEVEYNCAASKCSLPDDDEMVSCETCRRWWHYTCANFNPTLFDTATPWFCRADDCDEVAKGQSKEAASTDVDAANVNEPDALCNALDVLIEAAKVPQSTVEQKDKEIATLKAEMDNLKSKMGAAASSPVQRGAKSVDLKKFASDRLEAIRQIDCSYKQILSSSVPHSTPLTTTTKKKQGPSNGEVKDNHSHQNNSLQELDMANLLTILNRSQVQELPSFSGHDKKEWPYFESVYRATTEEGRYNNKKNVARLRKALKGEAYDFVSERLRYSTDADGIMDTLRTIFGRSDVLVHNLTSNLLKLPSLSSGSDTKLRQWAVTLNGFIADIRSMNLSKELENNFVLTDLSSKMSSSLYHDWQKRRFKNPNVNMEDFAVFITEKLYDLPPELNKSSKLLSNERGSTSCAPKRVLTHKPVSASEACVKCDRAEHELSECKDFIAMTVDERFTFAKGKAICFRCLKLNPHNWKSCSQKKLCGVEGCSKLHHPLLHLSSPKAPLNSSAPPFVPPAQIHSSHLGVKAPVMFKVVPIRLYGNNNKYLDTFAFLDDGSSITMVERDVFEFLDLIGEPEQLTLQWTKGVSRTEESLRTSLRVSAVNKRKRYTLRDIYTVNGLELPCQSINIAVLQQTFAHLKDLPLVELNNAKPKILLGLDQAKLLVGSQQRAGKDDEPHAIKTPLGWTVFGTMKAKNIVSCVNPPRVASISLFHGIGRQDEELHELVKSHFSTEDFGVKLVSKTDIRAISVMERSLCHTGEHYEIGLLWDQDEVKLPDSYPMAEKRLVGLEKSLLKKPELLEWMNQHIRELISKGYVRIATPEELNQEWSRVWYAPIFVVENKNKFPPKPRVVADVAAKVNGISMNSRQPSSLARRTFQVS